MKNSDIAAIIVIAIVSMVTAYFVADAVIGRSSSESVKVKSVDQISADIVQPDSSIFNKDAINPTVPVIIGDSSNTASSSTTTSSTTASEKASQ